MYGSNHCALAWYIGVKGSKDEVELPQRKRVKVEQEPEEVSTVITGKVVVSAMGSARIVGRNQSTLENKTGRKLMSKTSTDTVAKKDDTELQQRKRVKVEQEPVISDRVVVSAMGSSHVLGRNQPSSEKKTNRKLLAIASTDSSTKKDAALQKKKSFSTRPDVRKVTAVKQGKASKQQKGIVHKAVPKSSKPQKSLKHSLSQQLPKKKKISV